MQNGDIFNCHTFLFIAVFGNICQCNPFSLIYSTKYVTQSVKDEDKSPLFSKSGKLSGLSQNIYDLLLCGLRGNLKKDAIISVLREITVSKALMFALFALIFCM